jgi:hypothetical protein
VSAIKKETISQSGLHQDNSAKRILQFTEQMGKVMAIKPPGVSSKKEMEKVRNTRESAELMASILLQRKNFKEALTHRKFQYVEVPGDNFCLFHSVATGLNRPKGGFDLLNQVIEYMFSNAETYKVSVLDEDLPTYLANLKKTGWGGELEIHAMSKMFDVEFEIWIPERRLGAVTQTQYSEGLDKMALAYYPDLHYDYLRKLKLKEVAPVLPKASESMANAKLPTDLPNKDNNISQEDEIKNKIRRLDLDNPISNAVGVNGLGRLGNSMTLEELSTNPSIVYIDAIGLNVDERQATSLVRNDGSGLVGTLSGGLIQSTPPDNDNVERRELSISDGTNSNVTQSNLPGGLVDGTQAREQLERPGDPSLDISNIVEGQTLNVNQAATGPV